MRDCVLPGRRTRESYTVMAKSFDGRGLASKVNRGNGFAAGCEAWLCLAGRSSLAIGLRLRFGLGPK